MIDGIPVSHQKRSLASRHVLKLTATLTLQYYRRNSLSIYMATHIQLIHCRWVIIDA